MKVKSFFRPTGAIVAALLSSIAAFLGLDATFAPIQRWYLKELVRHENPDASALPFEWVVFLVFPILATAVGGLIAGLIFRQQSIVFNLLVGLTFCATTVIVMLKHPPDWPLLFFSLLLGGVGVCGVILGHWVIAKTHVG